MLSEIASELLKNSVQYSTVNAALCRIIALAVREDIPLAVAEVDLGLMDEWNGNRGHALAESIAEIIGSREETSRPLADLFVPPVDGRRRTVGREILDRYSDLLGAELQFVESDGRRVYYMRLRGRKQTVSKLARSGECDEFGNNDSPHY
jgi:hypothetical protein